jgi:hypothetical protein
LLGDETAERRVGERDGDSLGLEALRELGGSARDDVVGRGDAGEARVARGPVAIGRVGIAGGGAGQIDGAGAR